jgi:hypothetical protein
MTVRKVLGRTEGTSYKGHRYEVTWWMERERVEFDENHTECGEILYFSQLWSDHRGGTPHFHPSRESARAQFEKLSTLLRSIDNQRLGVEDDGQFALKVD